MNQSEILAQKEEIHNLVMLKSLKAAGVAGGFGVLGHFGLTAYSQRYARHRMPWKVFGLICIPMAVFFTSSEFYTRDLYEDLLILEIEILPKSFLFPCQWRRKRNLMT